MKTSPGSQNQQEPHWLQHIRNYYWIHDVLQIYTGLSSWVLEWDGEDLIQWMELTPQAPLNLRPTHFEKFYGQEAERVAFYRRCLKKVVSEKKVVIDQCGGFYSFFAPLGSTGAKRWIFYADFFLKQPADWDSLAGQWRKLTGKEPVGSDPDFLSYVKMALKFPVFDEILLKGIKEFIECYVDFLMGHQDGPPLYPKVDKLRQEVFAKRLPNSTWVQEALGLEKLIPPPWAWYSDHQLAPWMKEELGIDRIPNTVMAMMPVQMPGEGMDPVKTLIRNYHIQRECFSFSKKVPQTVAEKLQDYGVLFLTSADPGKNEVQARLQLRDRAQTIQEFIKKTFHLKSVVGIGRPVMSGQALYPSYREAVLALHLCVQTEKPFLFFDDPTGAVAGPVYSRLHKASLELLDAYDRVSNESVKLASDRYVREVLEFSAGHVDVVRSQFLAQLFQFLDRLKRRSLLNPKDAAGYANGFCRKLEDAASIYNLIGIFKETLQNLTLLAARPLEGSKSLRMETTLEFLRENFAQELRLPKVAKEAGFSVPVFCRVFKKTTGLSFVSYLNKLRVEKAKVLLTSSGLNVIQVGNSCGFQTPHHFIRNFKQWTGQTPGDFRKKLSSR